MTQIEQLLEASGTELRVTNKVSEVTLCCPFCESRGFSADINFHLGLNTFNGKAHCFRCDWRSGNLLYTAKQLRYALDITFDLSERELRRKVAEPEKVEKKAKQVQLPDEYERLPDTADFIGRKVQRYLAGRGVSLLQIIRHKIGYAAAGKYAWRAIVPVLGRGGGTFGWVSRAIKQDQEPKYLNSPGLKMLWNTETVAGTAVVVEGVMDALRVETALLQTTGMAAVARLGSSITQIQLDQLRQYEKLIIFPDFDTAGIHGARELGARTAEAGIVTSVIVPKWMTGADPGSMTDEEILELIGQAVPWSSSVSLRMRLASTRRRML